MLAHFLVFLLQPGRELNEAKTNFRGHSHQQFFFVAKFCGTVCGASVLSVHLYGNSLIDLFNSSTFNSSKQRGILAKTQYTAVILCFFVFFWKFLKDYKLQNHPHKEKEICLDCFLLVVH